MIDNPFTYGNPISAPSRFHGRREELRQIVNRLRSSARESTSIVGERRIGKTSLLKHLANPQVIRSLGIEPAGYYLVYIDFQGLTDITPQRFWERVLRKTAREAGDQTLQEEIKTFLEMETYDLFDLEDLFEEVLGTGKTLVLLMDEFEYVTQNTNFQSDFFGGLRALAIHQNLVLVTATRRELVDLCHSEEIKGSPFFNIFASVILRPFQPQEAAQLVDAYAQGTSLEHSPGDKELILTLGGRCPFFVQMAGYHLVEAKARGLPDTETYKETITCFEEQAAPHFSYLWSHCIESEQITLLATISLNRGKQSKKTIATIENLNRIHQRAGLDVPSLTRRGLLLEDSKQGTYKLFSPSLESWIIREIAAAPGEEESQETAESWLESQDEDVLEPVKGVLPRVKKEYWPVVSIVLRKFSFELAGAATSKLLIDLFF